MLSQRRHRPTGLPDQEVDTVSQFGAVPRRAKPLHKSRPVPNLGDLRLRVAAP